MILTKEKIQQINLDELINLKVKSGRFDEFLIIVPTNRKIRNLRKELVSITPSGSASDINLETLGTISTKLLMQVKPFKLLSDTASFVMMKQSISAVKLRYFSDYSGEIPTGTISRIINVIDEYKKHGVTPGALLAEAASLEGIEKLKAVDIAAIYSKYQEYIGNLDSKDTGDIYSELTGLKNEEFSDCFKRCFRKVQVIVVDGFDEFSNLEIDILNLLSGLNNIKVFVNFDYYLYNPSVFSHLDRCYEKLLLKGFISIKDSSYINLEKFRDIIREKLFVRNIIQKEFIYSSQIVRIEAGSRAKEIELIAKEIKDLIIEKKVEPHEICVSFNLIEKYSPIIRDQFTKYGIPFNLSDRYWLKDSTAVIAVINFLEILENDFYYKNIFRTLNNGLFDLGDIDPTSLMKVSKELKIVSGYKNWINNLNDSIDLLTEKETFNNQEFIENEKKRYHTALQNIKKLRQLLEPFIKKQNYKDFISNLVNLLSSLNIYSSLAGNLSDSSSTERDKSSTFYPLSSLVEERNEINIKAASVFIETIIEVFTLFERHDPNEEHTLGYYLDRIRSIAQSTRYNIREKSKYGVQITTLNEIRGLKFDYLFISGLCDGDFPTKYNPEVFFSGSFIKGENNHQVKERYHFYQGLSLWRKKLYLTFPAFDDNRELVESSFLKDLCGLFETSDKTVKDYSSSFYAIDEVLKAVGKINNIEYCKELFSDNNYFDWNIIKHSLNVAEIRAEKTFNSIFSGCLNEPEIDLNQGLSAKASEELRNLKSQQFSITQLEKYAACPYQYFLSKVIKIEVIEAPSEEMESIELGTLLHSILFNFSAEINNRCITLKKCNNKIFNEAESLLFSIAERIISEKPFKSSLSFFELERITGINGNRKNSILYKFLEYERENSSDFVPKFFEVGFGKVSGDQKDRELKYRDIFRVDDLILGGQIDRIEINEEENVFNVVDYKLSGKKPLPDDMQNGLSLQLPFYMYAASEMLRNKYNRAFDPATAYIYSLKFKSKDFGKTPVNLKGKKSYEQLDEKGRKELVDLNIEIINNCIEKMKVFVKNIGEGKFNLSDLDNRETKVCRYCNFKTVCRIQEMV